MSSTRRPNILLITTDQQRGDCLGVEGRPVRTPHIDQLAGDGTRFSACITANPICQPSRASILTGLLPLSHGVYDNGVDLDPAIGEAGFAGRLSKAGYDTALIGKAHFSTKGTFAPTGTPECQTSSADYPADWYGPYMGFEHVELAMFGHPNRIRPQLRPPHGQHFEKWFFTRGEDGEAAFRAWEQGLPPDVGAAQTWNSALPVVWHPSSWVGERTMTWLRERQRNAGKDDRPFMLWASFGDPHHPFDCPEPWSRMHHPDEVDLPEHRRHDLDRRPWWHRASLEKTPELADPNMRKFRAEGSRVPDQTDEQLRHMIANYYGMISLIDHNVGCILTALDELGLADDTLVIFTSDHGDLLGDHGLYLKGPTPYEGLLRVPFVCRGPGVPAGKVVADPVSTVDLAATFCDYAGSPTDDSIQSRSLRPLIERDDAHREAAYMEWNLQPSRCGVPLELRTVRTRTHKLTLDLLSGAGELYDLARDPAELENRFDDPASAAVRAELEALIAARPGPPARSPLAEPVGMA